MSFETDVSEADRKIREGYLDLVVNSYKPLFERTIAKAVNHMKHDGVKEIKLGIKSTPIVLKADGKFYDTLISELNLRDFPRVYQHESDSIAGQADDRSHMTPTIHTAMQNALYDLRESVKKSLVATL